MLTLTATQEALRYDLGQDGADARWAVRIRLGAQTAIVVSDPDFDGECLDVLGDSGAVLGGAKSDTGSPASPNGATITNYGTVTSGGTNAETAQAIAQALRVSQYTVGASGEPGGAWALQTWAVGAVVYVRAPLSQSVCSVDSSTAAAAEDATERVDRDYWYVDGPTPVDGYPAILSAVGQIGAKRDWATGEISRGKTQIELMRNEHTEWLVGRCIFKGREARLWRGTPDYSVSDWIPAGGYLVSEGPLASQAITVDASDSLPDHRGVLKFKLEDLVAARMSETSMVHVPSQVRSGGTPGDINDIWTGIAAPRHPLELLSYALESNASFPSDELLDASSLDPSDSTWIDYSHHVVALPHGDWAQHIALWRETQAVNSASVLESVTAISGGTIYELPNVEIRASMNDAKSLEVLLKEIQRIMPWASVGPEEDAKIRARVLGTTGVTWGVETFRMTEHLEANADLINRVDIAACLQHADAPNHWRSDFPQHDALSMRAHGFGGLDWGRHDMQLDSRLINGVGFLSHALPDTTSGAAPQRSRLESSSTGFWIVLGGVTGFSGGAFIGDGDGGSGASSVPTSWSRWGSHGEINGTTRKAYVMLSARPDWPSAVVDPGGGEELRSRYMEVIELSDLEPDTAAHEVWASHQGREYFPRLEATIATRAVHGSTPEAWLAGTVVHDVTIQKEIADWILDAAAWGIPVIKGYTPLSQMHVQLGDFVSIDFRLPPAFLAGDSTWSWMVVSKEVRRERVIWTLAGVARTWAMQINQTVPTVEIETSTPEVGFADDADYGG